MSEASSTADLQSKLDEYRAGFRAKADQSMQDTFAAGVQAVVDAGIAEASKQVGDTAPGFTLPDATGKDVRLSELLANGPVVVTWYRGGWCPYCNIQLHAYQQVLDEIHGLGAELVALTPELPDRSLDTQQKNELAFRVLSDVGNQVARTYGVVFDLTPDVHRIYNELFGFDAYNGNDSGELPLAATYVIDRDGTIRYAFLDADYTKRAEPADVLEALRGLDR